MTPGLGSGQVVVLASTPDGLRGPVVDDGIKVNGQLSVGFVFVSGMPAPAIGQPIDSTGLEQPVAPIDVTAAVATGTLAVDLIDTGGIGGNAPLYLVTRETATNQVLESRLLFPARATFASTTPLGTPLVVASTTVGVTTPVANGTLFYHQDGLGTVTDLTDSAGAPAKSYSYDAYGNILESPGAVDQPYTYTGRELDSETGLYYYRARYYDAQIGKFTQRDPIGRVGGNNYYEYALGDPTLHFDPFGLKAQVVIWAPVGIGTSSFGHVSTNINGTTYSFGPNGMTNEPTPVFDQRNSFRSSLGLDLNLTVEQEKALDECLKRDQPEYNFLTNNCGAPVQRCLNWMGYDIGQVLTPAQLYESMTGVGLVGGTIFYPGAATKPVQSK
jgi:RHS repeat-associated protein